MSYSIEDFNLTSDRSCKKCGERAYVVIEQVNSIGKVMYAMRCEHCGAFVKFVAHAITAESLADYIIPTGMHAGKRLQDLPCDYIKFMSLKDGNVARKCKAWLEKETDDQN